MDSIFLDGAARAIFIRHAVQSFGCTYICLWSYFPQPSNSCLIFIDGLYMEENINQPSSSSGSFAQRLFDEYRQSIFIVKNEYDTKTVPRVPGHAFKNNLPFVELKELDLRRLASVEAQLQFYQEARIKTAIFMGCKAGEIELGMPNDTHQVNLETVIRNWFPQDFSPKNLPLFVLGELISLPSDQNWPSPPSSSLISASMDSSACSPFSFNIPSTSKEEDPTEQALFRPKSTSTCPLHQAMQDFSQTKETEDSAITKAIVAVLSSTTSLSSSSHDQNQQNYPITQKASAFERYRSALPLPPSNPIKARARRQNMLKRAIAFFTTLSLMQAHERVLQGSQPTITQAQFHHVISERKRREKLNESIRALTELLPPGTKKDKVSVLNSTTKYMTSLKAQVEELTQRNQTLEAQVLTTKEETAEKEIVSSEERLDVQVTDVAESTSEATIVSLEVTVRGECNMLDLMILIVDFLKEVKNVRLLSVKGDRNVAEPSSISRFKLRLKIEGGEWDKSAFEEAARRVAADIAQ